MVSPWSSKVANYLTGASAVNKYSDGIAALKSGKAVRFNGAGGATHFNQYNNSQGGYIVAKYDTTGNEVVAGQLSQDQIDQIIKLAGA